MTSQLGRLLRSWRERVDRREVGIQPGPGAAPWACAARSSPTSPGSRSSTSPAWSRGGRHTRRSPFSGRSPGYAAQRRRARPPAAPGQARRTGAGTAPRHVTSRHVTPRHVTSRHVTSRHAERATALHPPRRRTADRLRRRLGRRPGQPAGRCGVRAGVRPARLPQRPPRALPRLPTRTRHLPDAAAAFEARAVTDLPAGLARFPEDRPLRRAIRELTAGSSRFAELWATPPPLVPMGEDRLLVDHPEVGTSSWTATSLRGRHVPAHRGLHRTPRHPGRRPAAAPRRDRDRGLRPRRRAARTLRPGVVPTG